MQKGSLIGVSTQGRTNFLTCQDTHETHSDQSPALHVLDAVYRSLPKSLGDRERIAVLESTMAMLVKNRFIFGLNDAQGLDWYTIRTCVGVFRPMSYYRDACVHGGTYARMWEKAMQIRPWMGAKVYLADRSAPEHLRYLPAEIRESSRVCNGAVVLMPADFTAPEPDLASFKGLQVWWCTSFTNDVIHLVRCGPGQSVGNHDGSLRHAGRPNARLRKLTREEWAIQQAKLLPSKAAQTGEAVAA